MSGSHFFFLLFRIFPQVSIQIPLTTLEPLHFTWGVVGVYVIGRSSTTATLAPYICSQRRVLPAPREWRVALNQGATGGREIKATRGKTSVRRSATTVGASPLSASLQLRLVSSAPGRPLTRVASHRFSSLFFNRIPLVAACCFCFENRKTDQMMFFFLTHAEYNVHYFSQLLLLNVNCCCWQMDILKYL